MATVQQPLAGFATAPAADLSKRDVQERLSPAAVPAFFKLADAWSLRDEAARQLLGGVSNGVFYQLKGGHSKTLDQDKLTRISLLLGIFKAFHMKRQKQGRMIQHSVGAIVQPRRRRLKNPVSNHAIEFPHRTDCGKPIICYQLLNMQFSGLAHRII